MCTVGQRVDACATETDDIAIDRIASLATPPKDRIRLISLAVRTRA